MFNFLLSPEKRLDSIEGFNKNIVDYFSNRDQSIKSEFKNKLYWNLAYKLREQYRNFRKKYPKTLKRYSTLKVEDIEHDFTLWWIIDFVKNDNEKNYKFICQTLFKMSKNEFDEYEKRRVEFEQMF